jgi:hypothetical protein
MILSAINGFSMLFYEICGQEIWLGSHFHAMDSGLLFESAEYRKYFSRGDLTSQNHGSDPTFDHHSTLHHSDCLHRQRSHEHVSRAKNRSASGAEIIPGSFGYPRPTILGWLVRLEIKETHRQATWLMPLREIIWLGRKFMCTPEHFNRKHDCNIL